MGIRETAVWSWRKWLRTGVRSTVARNAASLYLIQFANYIVPLIMVPYLVRVLGPAGYGAVAFAQGFINYLMLFVEYGFDWSATRKISVQRENLEAVNHTALHVWAAKGLLALAGFVVLLALTALVPKLGEVRLLLLALYGMVLGNVLFPTWLFQGMERMVAISVINLGMKLSILAGVFLLVKRSEDAALYAGLLGGGSFLAGLTGAAVAFWMFRLWRVKISLLEIWRLLIEGGRLALSKIFINSYTSSRIFIIGFFVDYKTVGLYAVAEKIATVIQTFILSPLISALYPRLSKLFAEDPRRTIGILNMANRMTTVSYAILIFWGVLFADLIVKIFAGMAYGPSVIVLRLLLVSVFFVNANAFRIQTFLIVRDYNSWFLIHFVGSLIGVITLVFLTYFYSLIGAALSVAITEFVVLLLTIFILQNKNFEKQ